MVSPEVTVFISIRIKKRITFIPLGTWPTFKQVVRRMGRQINERTTKK